MPTSVPTHPPPRRRTRVGLVLVVAASALLAGCSAASDPPPATPTSATPASATQTSVDSASPHPSTTATPTPGAPSGPGTPLLTAGPVLAVKIDNTSGARPRIGLDAADVVYVEPVEGGLTRLLAVFGSRLPAVVGPIRSARESDAALLGNWGPVAFAFSGASDYTWSAIAAGPQVEVTPDRGRSGFRREPGRRAPYDLVGDPATLLARAGGGTRPGDVGFRAGPAVAGGIPASGVSTRYPAATLDFAWDPASGRYLLTTDGRPEVTADGARVGAAAVLVQTVRTRPSPNRDVNGAVTPVVEPVGSGPALVLRNGLRYAATWSRPASAAPTDLRTAAGDPLALGATPVWVVLVAPGQVVTVR